MKAKLYVAGSFHSVVDVGELRVYPRLLIMYEIMEWPDRPPSLIPVYFVQRDCSPNCDNYDKEIPIQKMLPLRGTR